LLLSIDFSHEEAKEFILCNCALSALVQQERIHNDTYLTIDNNISDDLLELKQEIFSKNFSNKN